MPVLEAAKAAGVYAGLSSMGSKVVVCDGVFDMLHPGHLSHLRQAKALGNTLLVLVASDAYGSKGPNHPQFPERERVEMVASLREVDGAVLVGSEEEICNLLKAWKPSYYCKGSDYKTYQPPALLRVKSLVESLGGQLVFTVGKPYSSRKLANGLPARVQAFLEGFRPRWPLAEVLRQVEAAETLKPVVFGEAIEDVYVKVKPRGMSPKGAALVYSPDTQESFAGGAVIVAKHLRALCPRVITILPPWQRIKKTRYVVEPFLHKAFILEEVEPRSATGQWPPLPPDFQDQFDFIVAADFGHDAFTREDTGTISELKLPLALTVQSNALNWGFNPVSRWPRCDYLVADEMECRLALQDKADKPEGVLGKLRDAMKAKVAIMTLGHEGCLVASADGPLRLPAFSQGVLDTTGAGDAFLAVSAPFFQMGLPPEFVAFMGSVAAAVHVGRLGNPPLSKDDLIGRLEFLLGSERMA